ncbi:MAG: hypothetical protein LBI05_00820 [Planctomycetaceae bacterium]|jgi:hypothetical protein|nr:hypothetical protein [Planctomycetaceae bacterium]
MGREIYHQILELVRKAAQLARSIGISTLLQPGLVKEMIIADILGHDLIPSKRGADAHTPGKPDEKYEYLSCKEGGTGQLDRMVKAPPEKRKQSLERITRNRRIYFAVFYKQEQIKCKVIYEIMPDVLLAEAERQLDRSTNEISHVGFTETWAKEHGKIVYQN